uniref:Uncharacterized protein n=1 Tax=Aegilops tauschii subsp. strangulata TaxID=200361 RepID=A0A453HUU6_AEGTS
GGLEDCIDPVRTSSDKPMQNCHSNKFRAETFPRLGWRSGSRSCQEAIYLHW